MRAPVGSLALTLVFASLAAALGQGVPTSAPPAALARGKLAQGGLDRRPLRAPFSGRLVASLGSDGQFVEKGTVIAELADISSLRTLVPLARAGLAVGASVNLTVEGQPVSGKVQ